MWFVCICWEEVYEFLDNDVCSSMIDQRINILLKVDSNLKKFKYLIKVISISSQILDLLEIIQQNFDSILSNRNLFVQSKCNSIFLG